MLNVAFYYKDKFYSPGTEIKLSKKYLECNTYDGMPIWPYAKYKGRVDKNGYSYYFFTMSKLDSYGQWRNYAGYFTIYPFALDMAIEEILSPIVFNYEQVYDKFNNYSYTKQSISSEKIVACIIYACVLIGSLIFKQFYLIWIIATFIFFKWSCEN